MKTYFELDQGLQKSLLDMLTLLSGRGMNPPETDTEEPTKLMHACIHWWLAPEIDGILSEIDGIARQAKTRALF